MSAFLNLQMVVGNEAATATVKEISILDIIIDSNAGIGWVVNIGLLAMFGYVVYIFFVKRFIPRIYGKSINFDTKINCF